MACSRGASARSSCAGSVIRTATHSALQVAAGFDVQHPPKALRQPVKASGNADADKAALVSAALKGLPVSSFPATWEPERPATVPEGHANKVCLGTPRCQLTTQS